MPRIKHVPAGRTFTLGHFEVPGFSGRRVVRAHVPAGENVRRPTLFLFDGQNVFDDHGSFAGGWHAHTAIDKLAASRRTSTSKVAPIVLGIDHGFGQRIHELSPFQDPRFGEGRLEPFVNWLVHGLMPEVHARFELASGPHGHIVGGSSMGGLAAMWAHFRRPDAIGGAMCMSPSFWFARRSIFDFVASQTNPYHSRVYLDCGAREGRGAMLPIVESMAQHLNHRGWGSAGALKLMWRPDAKGQHAEHHWRRRLPKALRFLYS